MKVKNVKIKIKDTKQVLREFAETMEKLQKGEKVEKHHEVSFQSVEGLRKFLTKKRLELLHTIKKENPESIYSLAKMVNRDLKSVNTDIIVLSDFGLISLGKVKLQREKVKPTVLFDKLNVEIAI